MTLFGFASGILALDGAGGGVDGKVINSDRKRVSLGPCTDIAVLRFSVAGGIGSQRSRFAYANVLVPLRCLIFFYEKIGLGVPQSLIFFFIFFVTYSEEVGMM